MDHDQPPEQDTLFPKSTGDKLREAREAQGMTLADIASRTRVPMRHLAAIELGDYSGVPSPTYAIGFARAYARVVGLDEKAIAAEVRANPHLPLAPVTDYEAYPLSDAKRLPSRGLAMAAGAIAILVVIGVIVWYGTSLFRGSGESGLVIPENTIAAAPEATPAPAPVAGGQVRLTATDSVWLRVYDASGTTLLAKTMAPGDFYDVPPTANNPMINIGRPDQIQVTINGSAVAPLGNGKAAIRDVPISATALQARGTATPAAVPTSVAQPVPTAKATSRTPALPPAFAPAESPPPRLAPAPEATPTPATGATPRP